MARRHGGAAALHGGGVVVRIEKEKSIKSYTSCPIFAKTHSCHIFRVSSFLEIFHCRCINTSFYFLQTKNYLGRLGVHNISTLL